jgi:hypothetical protein
MRAFSLLFSLITLCGACHPGGQLKRPHAVIAGTTTEVLRDKDIYKLDSVQACLRRSGVSGALQAKKIFLKAIDLYRNQKNASASIELFQESVRIWPDAKSYYELGNALMDANDYAQSLKAFEIALNLQFIPASNCFYNMACAYSMEMDSMLAFEYLHTALDSGYANKKQLLRDPDLEFVRKSNTFRSMIVEHFNDNDDIRDFLFNDFLRSFPALPTCYQRDLKDVGKYDLTKALNYDFAPFIPGMTNNVFSREVSSEYEAIGKKEMEKQITLVAYSSIQTISDTLLPVNTYLITYDSTGTQVETKLFSCYCDPHTILTGKLDSTNVLTVTALSQEWKFDPDDKGYAGNAVTGVKKVKEEKFRITDGKFIPLDPEMPVSAKKN